MRYSGGLVKKEREDIFKLFTSETRLKFNEIEKAIRIRSNMVSYHLEKMQQEGLLEKRGEWYHLTKKAERYLPIVPHVTGKEMSPLPVVLVAVMNGNKILLLKRGRRPYKGYWGLVGGKMLLSESFMDASVRQVKSKTGLDGKFVSVNSVLHERVVGEEIVKHSFILFFTKMVSSDVKLRKTEYGELGWFSLDKLSSLDLIPSDYWLIKNKLNSQIPVKSAFMDKDEGELSGFRVLE